MNKILVTGANGFLGSWLIRELNRLGEKPIALVRKTSDLSELEGLNYDVIYGDVTDFASLQTATQGIHSVFHLAGLIAYKKADRARMEQINVQGTRNMIQASLANHVQRFVHLSSVVTVGAGFNESEVLNEKSSFQLSHLNLGYFETKLKAEQFVLQAVREQGLNAVIVNPSTIYGPGDARKGSRKIQIKVARGEFPFYTPGGVNVVGVEDIIQGILAAWKIGRTGERYILAGENLTIYQLFKNIAEVAGQPVPRLLLPKWLMMSMGRWGDLKNFLGLTSNFSTENAWTSTLFHWFDSSKARQELGFQTQPAAQAIEKSVLWMKEHGYL